MQGVELLKKVMGFACEIANVGEKLSLTSGMLAKAWLLLGLKEDLAGLGGVNVPSLIAEVKDLDDSEMKELCEFVKLKLNLTEAHADIEKKIEGTIDNVVKSVGLVDDLIALWKKSPEVVSA